MSGSYVYEWKKLPSRLVTSGSLAKLTWRGEGVGATNAAALMLYMAIGFYAVQKFDEAQGLFPGEAAVTYERLQDFTGLSRELIKRGINKLEQDHLILVQSKGRRNIYSIHDFDDRIWMKIPCKYLSKGRLQVKPLFANMSVRNQYTLYAMKLYFVIMERRNTKTNHAAISYEKLVEYSGIPKNRIKKTISTLVSNELIFCDLIKGKGAEYRHNIYRVRGIGDYQHLGTLSDENIDELTG